jgi:hypothetical protein
MEMSETLVIKEQLVIKEMSEQPVLQEKQEQLETLARLVLMETQVFKGTPESQALRVLRVTKAHKVHKVQPELQERQYQEKQVLLVQRVNVVLLVHKANMVLLVNRANMVLLVNKVFQAKRATLERTAIQGNVERQGVKELKDPQVTMVPLVKMADQVLKAQQEVKV